MTDQQKKDDAIEQAGKILIATHEGFHGFIKFNLQGKRKTVHANVCHEIGVEVVESKQFGADG